MRIPFLVACLAGCATEVAVDAVEQAIGMEPGDDGTGGGCPVWGCGSNTSKTHGIGFTTISELGLPNDEGFSIIRFEKFDGVEWRAYRPDVTLASLTGRDLVSNAVVLQDADVVGARFEIYNSATNLFYYLTVAATETTPLWAQPDPMTTAMTRTYRLQWEYKPGQSTPATNPEDICGPNPDTASGPMANFFAVLFEDDHIDVEALNVLRDRLDWFNIGCAGHALAKQHLLGHTKAAGLITNTATSTAQRTANLKMITADYCGNGHPFTVPGQLLRWRDEHGWYDSLVGTSVIEARWTENGAACLNIPRVEYNSTTLGLETFPDGIDALLPRNSYAWCATRPPACTGLETEMQGAHVISVNQH